MVIMHQSNRISRRRSSLGTCFVQDMHKSCLIRKCASVHFKFFLIHFVILTLCVETRAPVLSAERYSGLHS